MCIYKHDGYMGDGMWRWQIRYMISNDAYDMIVHERKSVYNYVHRDIE